MSRIIFISILSLAIASCATTPGAENSETGTNQEAQKTTSKKTKKVCREEKDMGSRIGTVRTCK